MDTGSQACALGVRAPGREEGRVMAPIVGVERPNLTLLRGTRIALSTPIRDGCTMTYPPSPRKLVCAPGARRDSRRRRRRSALGSAREWRAGPSVESEVGAGTRRQDRVVRPGAAANLPGRGAVVELHRRGPVRGRPRWRTRTGLVTTEFVRVAKLRNARGRRSRRHAPVGPNGSSSATRILVALAREALPIPKHSR